MYTTSLAHLRNCADLISAIVLIGSLQSAQIRRNKAIPLFHYYYFYCKAFAQCMFPIKSKQCVYSKLICTDRSLGKSSRIKGAVSAFALIIL